MACTEYGRYSSRIFKKATKHFFPHIHEALKPLAAMMNGDFPDPDPKDDGDDINHQEGEQLCWLGQGHSTTASSHFSATTSSHFACARACSTAQPYWSCACADASCMPHVLWLIAVASCQACVWVRVWVQEWSYHAVVLFPASTYCWSAVAAT